MQRNRALLIWLLALPALSWGQGCVCQRQNVGGYAAENAYLAQGDWIFSGVFQNSVSNRHYQGTDFISSLSDRGPDNVQNLFNLNVTRAFTNRLSIGLDVPISTTSYTLNRVPPGSPAGTAPVKDAVGASGLGDITVRASYWLKSTGQAKQNLALGIGLEAPTGSADVRDTIYGRVVPVDVSTQLGAKAWAPSLSARGFRTFGYVTAYGSAVYLFNPRGTTGVPTFFGSISNPNNRSMNSSTDQFAYQVGAAGRAWRRSKSMLAPTVSYRVTGVPINDVFGPSNGFRRPADVQFIEPGITFTRGPQVVSFTTSILTYVNVKPTPANPNVTDATIPKYLFTIAFAQRVNGKNRTEQ